MQIKWYHTRWARWVSAILLPPVGLVLLWIKPGGGLIRKILGTILISAIGVKMGFLLLDWHLELDGSGLMPMVRKGKPETNYEKLEQSRAQQVAVVPAVLTAAPAAAPAQEAKTTPPEQASAIVEAAPAVPEIPSGNLYWTDFRGPNREGIYGQAPILTVWPKSGLERLWKQPIGGGWASFTAAAGVAFTIEQRRAKEAVTAYDMRTGRELWAHSYDADFQESMGGPGPRATPVYHQGLVYSLGATGELRVLDAKTGKLKWGKNILSDNDAQNIQWAMSAAPLIVDGNVIVQPGGLKGKSIVAYNKLTGARVWSVLNDIQSYTSPILTKLNGIRQIITVTGSRMVGMLPDSGILLWEYPWTTEYDINAAQPIVVDETHVYISAGYGHGAALVEVNKVGDQFTVRSAWSNTKMKNKFASAVLYNGYIYGLDEAILACMDVKTGELKWKGGRYGYGQLLLASGHLVVMAENGDVALVKATPAGHQEVSRYSAIEGKTWNIPAIDNGILLVRNTSEMAAFKIGK